jgi:DNA-binding NarL/FixJ family response regulator
LSNKGDVAVVGDAYTESDTVRFAREWHPDVLLLDALLFNASGIATLTRVNASSPNTKILVFAAALTEQFVLRALRHGASGCLRLGTSAQDVLSAIMAVQAGELWATRKIVSQAYQQLLLVQEPVIESGKQRGAQLSARQLEIVAWMRRGMTNKEIGRRLGISDMTVKTHAHNIFHKLEISGRRHLFGWPRGQPVGGPLETRSLDSHSTVGSVVDHPPKRRRVNTTGRNASRPAAAGHPPELATV